jgi:hypothetical protein
VITCFTQVKTEKDEVVLPAVVIDGDTLPNVQIKPVNVFPKKVFASKRQKRKYTRLMYNVQKAYPFSIIARNELYLMDKGLENIHGDKERKKYIKDYEKQMFAKYEDELKKLTMSQGRILLKLVDREIGNTSFNLVKEYRGSVSASFWQGIARLFGSNMKAEYDPKGEDAEIEEIIQMIEAGVI